MGKKRMLFAPALLVVLCLALMGASAPVQRQGQPEWLDVLDQAEISYSYKLADVYKVVLEPDVIAPEVITEAMVYPSMPDEEYREQRRKGTISDREHTMQAVVDILQRQGIVVEQDVLDSMEISYVRVGTIINYE